MSVDFIGRSTNAGALKSSLDGISSRVRTIAGRIATASENQAAFTLPTDSASGAEPQGERINLEQEMASLAEEQLRFDATAKLLEKTYAGLRASLRER